MTARSLNLTEAYLGAQEYARLGHNRRFPSVRPLASKRNFHLDLSQTRRRREMPLRAPVLSSHKERNSTPMDAAAGPWQGQERRDSPRKLRDPKLSGLRERIESRPLGGAWGGWLLFLAYRPNSKT